MKYRIVQMVDNQMVVTEPTDIVAWANVAGVEIVGTNQNKAQRYELYRQPLLRGFCGPMWDGGAIRYEDRETNDALSA